jgi:AcrR family transcriptional regulator
MKKDPRAQRTRRQLHEALLALIAERGYEAVTVQDVLDRAGVARSSFYAHFRDKEDLLFAGFKDVAEAAADNLFVAEPAERGGVPDLGGPLFRHVEENKAIAAALFATPAGDAVAAHMRNLLVVQARPWVQRYVASRNEIVPIEFVVQYLVGALSSLLMWWVRHDFPHSADEMGEAYTKLALSGLAELRS